MSRAISKHGSRAAAKLRRGLLAAMAYAFAAGTVAAQVMSRPTSVWGDVPEEQQGLGFGGVELLTGLLMTLVILTSLNLVILLRARRLFLQARSAEGSEAEFLWARTQQTQQWLHWIAYGLLPFAAIVTLLVAPARTLFGFGIAELCLGIFLTGSLIAAATFLLLEAIRKSLGAERI